MSTKSPTLSVGLRIEQVTNQYDKTPRLLVHAMLRRPEEPSPINGNSTPFGGWDHEAPKHLYGRSLAGLHLRAFVSTSHDGSDARLIGYENAMVQDVYYADQRQIAGVLKALQMVDKAIAKEQQALNSFGAPLTFGRAVQAFAKSIKAEWFAIASDKPLRPVTGFYTDHGWSFVPIHIGIMKAQAAADALLADATATKREELRA